MSSSDQKTYEIPDIVLDVETYRDYFMVGFMNVTTGKLVQYEMYPGHPLNVPKIRAIMMRRGTMSFNGDNYDVPMIFLALKIAESKDPEEACLILKAASDRIIRGLKPWQFWDAYGMRRPRIDHVDIFNVAPGMASLKIYGGRVHSKKMQDLPIAPEDSIGPDERKNLLTYNHNDLLVTADLRADLIPQLELRCRMSKQHDFDLRSKSDAQIAETVISRSLERLSGERPVRPGLTPGHRFKYRPPGYIQFQTETMIEVMDIIAETEFEVSDKGKVVLPKSISENHIHIGDSVYRMGIGGLHSSEEKVSHHADDEFFIVDRDVASYYPAIILNQKLHPKHLGAEFLSVYRSIVNQRLKAKREGDKVTADSLKITINGSFGKFGSHYSALYSPELLIQVTLSGQLSLLLLIETLECRGIQVISANTDGVVIKCRHERREELDRIVADWEAATGFDTEETPYRALYSRDVNNYIAVKPDGSVKLKGAYAKAGLQKNPTNQICVEAVAAWLTEGEEIEDTIYDCDDVRKFVSVRQVQGGAVKRHGAIPIPLHETKEELIEAAGMTLQPHRLKRWGWNEEELHTLGEAYKLALKHFTKFEHEDYLGKAIRWVYGRGIDGPIQYKSDNRIVPRSYGAKPVMDLPDYSVPEDINYQWYIDEAYSILRDIGCPEAMITRDPLI